MTISRIASFEAVLVPLEGRARAIREQGAGGPQPIVLVLDVSRAVSLRAKRDARPAAKPRAKAKAR